MEGFELSIVINRPIEEVFAVLANLEKDIKWRSEWVETKNMSGGVTWRRCHILVDRRVSRPADADNIRGHRVRNKPERGVENRVRTCPDEISADL